MVAEQRKRNIAYKLRIGDIDKGKLVLDGERFSFLEIEEKKVIRVNIVANVIDKYDSEGEKKYTSFTIDDASGQIRVKVFGDDVDKFKEITQGNTVIVIGLLRIFNNEVYIIPEIIKIQDPRYLLIRKLELEKTRKHEVHNKEEILVLKDQLIKIIKGAEPDGIETEKLVLDLKSPPDLINKEVQKLLEDGVVYEPRPGVLRYLG